MHKFAAVQMCSGLDVTVNLREAGKLMAKAAAGGAELIVLPENFALMAEGDLQRVAAGEVDGSGQIQDFLAEKAQSLKTWIVGGTVPVIAGRERVYARCPVYAGASPITTRSTCSTYRWAAPSPTTSPPAPSQARSRWW